MLILREICSNSGIVVALPHKKRSDEQHDGNCARLYHFNLLCKQRMEPNDLGATAYFLLFRDGWRFPRRVGTTGFVGTLSCIGFFRPAAGIRLLLRRVG